MARSTASISSSSVEPSSGCDTRPTLTVVGASSRVSVAGELLGSLADLLGDHERPAEVGLREQDDELVAGVAIGGVHGADRAPNGAGDAPNGGVTPFMAQRVVDQLQAVHVDHEQAEGAQRTAAAPDLLVEVDVDLGPVEQSGERIGDRQLEGRRLEAPLLGGEDHGRHGTQPDHAQDHGGRRAARPARTGFRDRWRSPRRTRGWPPARPTARPPAGPRVRRPGPEARAAERTETRRGR